MAPAAVDAGQMHRTASLSALPDSAAEPPPPPLPPARAGAESPAAGGALLADYSGLGLLDFPRGVPDNLRALNIGGNALVQLPPGLGSAFAALRVLDVSGNRLTLLPDDIGGLRCLRELHASRNLLAALPASLGALSGLEVLDVSENRLARLPPCLGLLAGSLRVLLADGNPLDAAHRALAEPILAGPAADPPRGAGKRERVRRALAVAAAGGLHADAKEHMPAIKKLLAMGLGARRDRSSSAPAPPPAPPHVIRSHSSDETAATTALTVSTALAADASGHASSSSASQSSRSSSANAAADPAQDAGRVQTLLWQLRDEWDLDPAHRDRPESGRIPPPPLLLGRSGTDPDAEADVGAAALERAYREKAASASNSQRMKILSELLVTEVTYVDTLKNVVGVFLNPMRETKILSESELREIFSNIEVILAFHNDHFLPSVTHSISQPEMAIGSVFLRHSAHFRLYSTYANNHGTSTRTLSAVMSRRTVSSFIRHAHNDVTQLGQVSLDGHLLTPVQRLPRYRMLLTDLLANTPPEHPDHEQLFLALKELNKIIYEVNERKRLFENQAMLRRLQDKIAGAADIPLAAPHRAFKLSAGFHLETYAKQAGGKADPPTAAAAAVVVRRSGGGHVYRYYLFSDMLLQCSAAVNKDLRLGRVYRLPPHGAAASITHTGELRIACIDRVIYLRGAPGEVQAWARAINHHPPQR
ncbi:hypothetical protein H4R18_004101 [Coemansia javaensis]|uniref:DH domain-containing protein n=1 Tax=Coemansia javaensis TaxID=2761396 RepID=A0A9W8HA19_9FUNG|nr:hypothetical protein H4R18_004101 [Coemansia javaensis]